MGLRKTHTFTISDNVAFKKAMLIWAKQFNEVVYLDSNAHTDTFSSVDVLLAVDAITSIETDSTNAFEDLRVYQAQTQDWLFGYLSYDLKNDIEALSSKNLDVLNFPELYFFQPKRLLRIRDNTVDFIYMNMVADETEMDFKSITDIMNIPFVETKYSGASKIKMRIFKEKYFKKVEQLLTHIGRGDIYEANFCQEFYCENIQIDPIQTYLRLNAISTPPFATFFKIGDKYLLSASPERYLKKISNTLISQPIKGTARRSSDSEEDMKLKANLEKDAKERAENIMIVDLVRNDLSKSALKGTVSVPELCKVYSFQQVHQMISTVTAEVAISKNPVDCIRESFPMGSMTGAPKISAMKIIEKLEDTKRGLYSGAVGYFTPENNFDFNVVIRSILYNATKKYVSFSVGSAITAMASPEKEYEECLLKAEAMRQVLEHTDE